MKTVLKIVGGLTIVVLFFFGAFYLYVSQIDTNKYKDIIIAKVKESTGRDLVINGEIKTTFLPHLGLQITELELANLPGFSVEPFATAKMVRIRVDTLLALSSLGGDIQIEQLVLDQLRLNMEKNATGQANWENAASKADIVSAEKPKANVSPAVINHLQGIKPAKTGMAALSAIGSIQIWDSTVKWVDELSSTRITATGMNATIGRASLGVLVPISMRMAIEAARGEVGSTDRMNLDGYATFNTNMKVDRDLKIIEISGVESSFLVKNPKTPNEPMEVGVRLKATVDLQNQGIKVELEQLSFDQLKARFSGTLEAVKTKQGSKYSGKLALMDFTARNVMELLLKNMPETSDPRSFDRLGAEIDFRGTNQEATIESLVVHLDDSTLTGAGAIHNFKQPEIMFKGEIDAFNLDRYLPASKNNSVQLAATPAVVVAGAFGVLPMEQLRKLNLKSELDVYKFKMNKLDINNVHVSLVAKDGDVRVYPATAELYEGSYSGDVRINVQGESPVFSMDEKIQDVQFGPLLKELKGKEWLSGRGNVAVKLQATGSQAEEMKKSLNGALSFDIGEGSIQGLNVAQALKTTYAFIKQQPLPPKSGENQTKFSSLSGSATVTNGVVSNEDFIGDLSCLNINGAGMVDIPEEQIDYLFKSTVVDTAEGLACAGMEDVQGKQISIPIRGSFKELLAKSQNDILKDAAREKVMEKVDKKLQENIEKLGGKDKVKELLKSFGF